MLMTELRKQKGLTMSGLARRAEMHVSSISQIENGHLRPYPRQAQKIASALDWRGDVSDLFKEKGGETQ